MPAPTIIASLPDSSPATPRAVDEIPKTALKIVPITDVPPYKKPVTVLVIVPVTRYVRKQ